MPSFASILALAAPIMVLAAPAPVKRDAATNVLVLKFADVLEQFESQFYTQALQKFQTSDFTSAGFVDAQVPVQQFTQIQLDESTHETVLASAIKALGDSPISDCQFDFGSALNDVPTMAATARVVENLGVSAYLGAAHLVDDPVLLTAAASILTVEARHQTILNVLNNGVSIPQAFDIGLLPNEVLAIAGAFIKGCDLGVPPNAPLTLTNTGAAQPGTLLTFDSPALNDTIQDAHCQMMVGGMSSTISLPLAQCIVPQGIEGPVAIFITADDQPLHADVSDRSLQPVIAGPTMAFIDTQKQLLSQLALAGSSGSGDNSSNDSSVTTDTITPPEATSIIASASAASVTGTAAAAAPSAPPESDSTVVQSAGTRNIAKGTTKNGAITIDGWVQ